MSLAVDHATVLWGLTFAALPLRRSLLPPRAYPWLPQLPADRASRLIDLGLRIAGVVAIAALTLGIAGLHLNSYTLSRVGQGAHVVMLLDRSRSMDDSFAGRTPTGGEISKSVAAERLLADFVTKRPHDRFGIAGFSTSPLFMLPLTDSHEAALAAIKTLNFPGLAQTHVAKGLAMALSYFEGPTGNASRIIVLVSDGAAAIDPDGEAKLRRWFAEKGVRLYWIFLRTAGSYGLFEPARTPDDDNVQVRPERYLHLFLQGLGIPYQAYEADNPAALSQAISDINRLENKALVYEEKVPRRDLQAICYLAALLSIALLGWGRRLEIPA
jgi:mxaC protein